jgi:hypothetical protein
VLREPAQLGHGEGRDGNDAHRIRPRPASRRATPQLADQIDGSVGGPGVVPEQSRPHHPAGLVEAHHPVLLRTHCHRGDVGQPAGLVQRHPQRRPPRVGVYLGALRVRGAPVTD